MCAPSRHSCKMLKTPDTVKEGNCPRGEGMEKNCNRFYCGLVSCILLHCSFVAMSCPKFSSLGPEVSGKLVELILRGTQLAAKSAFKLCLRNPRISLFLLAVYFYKDIMAAAKDTAGYFVGEYPEISFLICVSALWYISLSRGSDEHN